MAIRSFRLLASLLVLGSSCQRASSPAHANLATACIDPAKIDSTGVCTMEYAPVCGCNGQTYANPCVARKAGLRTFSAGPCPTRP